MESGHLPLSAGHVHLFGDAAESVYQHYNDEIRKHIAAGHALQAQAREIEALRAELAALRLSVGTAASG
jgi:hypothetical protein